MRRYVTAVALLFAVFLGIPRAAAAQQDPEGVLYVGYSYLRVDLADADEDEAHGFEVDYTLFLHRRVGFTVSFSGHWGTLPAPPNIYMAGNFDLQQLSLLAGPHWVLWRGLTSEAGLRLLAGATNRRLETEIGGIEVLDRWKFTGAAQLDFEFRLFDRVWVRVPQATLMYSRFDGEWNPDWRIGAGLVIRGGEILQ